MASSALPAVLPNIHYKDKILIDGGSLINLDLYSPI